MKSNREILSELLADESIKKILIGENHNDHTPKDLLLDNMDLFIDKTVTKGRKVKILLEFVNSNVISKSKEMLSTLVKSGFDMDKALDLLIDKYIFPEKFRCYATSNKILNLIKTAWHYGIDIEGVESDFTSNISMDKRIETFNTGVSALINKHSAPNTIIILLAGSIHMVDMVGLEGIIVSKGIKSRINQEKDTVAWLVKDSNSQEKVEYDKEITLPHGGFKLQFDLVAIKNKETEQQHTFEIAGNQLKPSLVVETELKDAFINKYLY